MPRTRLNWRQNLSAPRNTALEMQNQQLRNAAILGRAAPQTDPLQEQYRELQVLRAEGAVAKQQSDLALAIETQRQKNAYFNTIHNLDAALIKQGVKPGSFQYVEAITALREQIPYGASDKEVAEDLKKRSVVADVEAAFAQRKRELMPPPESAVTRYAKAQGDIKQFTEESAAEEAINEGKNLPNVPFSKAPALHGAQKEVELLKQQYQGLESTEPTATTAITNPAVPVVPSVTPAATPDPRMDLANRALTDPNATDAHRAAARRILGVKEDNAE